MTYKQALEVLIQQAAHQVAGAGRGIAHVSSDREKREVLVAIARLWPRLYGVPFTEVDARNLGLRPLVREDA